jgi:hypothetical protein
MKIREMIREKLIFIFEFPLAHQRNSSSQSIGGKHQPGLLDNYFWNSLFTPH